MRGAGYRREGLPSIAAPITGPEPSDTHSQVSQACCCTLIGAVRLEDASRGMQPEGACWACLCQQAGVAMSGLCAAGQARHMSWPELQGQVAGWNSPESALATLIVASWLASRALSDGPGAVTGCPLVGEPGSRTTNLNNPAVAEAPVPQARLSRLKNKHGGLSRRPHILRHPGGHGRLLWRLRGGDRCQAVWTRHLQE